MDSRKNTCAMVTPAVGVAAAKNILAPAILGAVALMGDFQLRLPNVMLIELPKLPKVSLPSLPSLPALPKKKEGATKAVPVAKTGAPAARSVVQSRAPVKIRAAQSKKPLPNAPTLAEAQAKAPADSAIKGIMSATPSISSSGWQKFSGRKLPGRNMGEFIDMARDINKF